MRLWLVCCIVLFIAAQGYDWIMHQAGGIITELAWLWVTLAGVGLAIASNLTEPPFTRRPPSPGQTAPSCKQSDEPHQITESATSPAIVATSRSRSISFNISRPQETGSQ